MNMKARIGLLVEAHGARRAGSELDGVARPIKRIGVESEVAGRHMKHADREAFRFRRTITGLGTVVGVGAVGLAGLGAALHASIDEYRDAYKVGQATNAVIASTGGVANVTADHVSALANKLSLQAGIDDELIQKGTNLLLTFKNIRNEVGAGNDIFDQTTQAAVDMSAAFSAAGKNMSVADAMLQLGKAINDPVKGMSRLQRIGVSFTEDQIKQAKALQKNGDLLGAQRIILGELTSEFGGAGAALADPWDRLHVAIKNLEESAGRALAPTLEAVATSVAGFVNGMEHGTGAGGKFVHVLKDVWGVTKDVYGVVRALAPAIAITAGSWAAYKLAMIGVAATTRILAGLELAKWLLEVARAEGVATTAMTLLDIAMIANPIGLLIVGLAALTAGFIYAYTHVKWFHNAVNDVWSWIKSNWDLLLPIIAAPLAPLIFLIKRLKDVVRWAKDAYDWLQKVNPFDVTDKLVNVTHLVSPPGRALGGPVTGGDPFIVGENGPEVFVPGRSGAIIPNGAQPVSMRNSNDNRPLTQTIILKVGERELARAVRHGSLTELLKVSPA